MTTQAEIEAALFAAGMQDIHENRIRMKAALEAAARVRWQSIETAPDDGSNVLVCGGRFQEASIVGADGGFWRHEKLKWGPKWWQPIPSPPESK